ncbi:MAG: UDP-N-acetylglucosamine pyrophosphorylase [Oscillospiraceae bacterium]|nr:UDP-N-acetylglucosamine pyrophosphorylase [Oscillospiraceae bacterium]
MESSIEITYILDLSKTIAADLFKETQYPWQVLPKIQSFILSLGKNLSSDKYIFKNDIWLAKNAKVANSAQIYGPTIIDENAEIRPGAFIRGNVIVGAGSVVGNSTELKNAILFDKVQVPHYNYVGDSILGYKAHLGAGAITSNVKSDGEKIVIHAKNDIKTGLKKLGAILGDCVEIGCNAVLNPGTIIGRNSTIYPLSSVRGVIPENHIYKSSSCIIPKNKIHDSLTISKFMV